MAQVTAFTAERMKEIEDTTVVGGLVDVNGNLLLTTREGTNIDAGQVKGDKGDKGDDGIEGSAALPAGTISLWASDVAPTNWLICDGSAVSRTEYASLFESIGIKYGAGDGVNTFNLPNLKGRTPVGKDSAQTEFATLAQIGGEKAHLLTINEMPSHKHTYGSEASSAATVNAGVASTLRPAAVSNTWALDTATTGGGAAHNILQPYQVVNFIIKVSNGDTPGDSQLTDRVSELEANFSSTPAGTMTMWPSDVAPSNWLICDGAAVSRTTYASLFAAIGVKYGAGDGVNTFNLPNLKGRTPVGKDSTQTEFNALAKIGGEKAHLLTINEIPAHNHTFGSGINVPAIMAGATAYYWNAPTGPERVNYLSGTTNTGGGAAHNILQPYQVVNFIIKFTNGDTKGDSQLTQRVAALEAMINGQALALRDRMQRAQRVFNGGGIRKVSTTGISWGTRFIIMGVGWEDPALAGYWDISMPADGTVIPVYGKTGVSSATVASGSIPLAVWDTLYYELPLDKNQASDPSRFRIVGYTAKMAFTPPPNWVMVVSRNGDATNSPSHVWGDGRQQDAWRLLNPLNGWVQYGGFSQFSWRWTNNGSIRIKGLIANGSTAATIIDWGTALGPTEQVIFLQGASTGMARADVNVAGQLSISGYLSGGTNSWVSMENVEWYPKGT